MRIRQVVLYYLKELGGVNHKQKQAETAALWDTETQIKAITCSPLKQNTLAYTRLRSTKSHKAFVCLDIYGGRELPLKIFKLLGIGFVIFFNFDLFLIFLFKIKASESKM